MGTVFSLEMRGLDEPAAERAARAAWRSLERDEARFSRFRSDGELARINAGEKEIDAASPELREVLALGLGLEVRSGGAFSVLDPSGSLDLDGIVKGWAADRALEAVRAAGCRAACLNAGGDIATLCREGPGWRIGVRSPERAESLIAVLRLRDGACASSGGWERGEHIRDARTGRPARGLASATVLAERLAIADALATAVFALGEPGVEWAVGNGARGVLARTPDGRLLTAGSLPLAAPFAHEP